MREPIKTIIKKKSETFYFLVALTAVYVLLESFVLVKGSHFYLGDYKLVADRIQIPATILNDVFYFFSIQILLHLLFALCIWLVTCLLVVGFQRAQFFQDRLALCLWLMGIVTILLSNQALYPNSKFAIFTFAIIPPLLTKILLSAMLISWLLIGCFTLYGLMLICKKYVKTTIGVTALIFIWVMWIFVPHGAAKVKDAASQSQPNVILIGVDALRPDFLGFYGGLKQTPNMDEFLHKATFFSESLTPLARTYPAWLSILTGEYPKKINVRFNLSENFDFDPKQTLPSILQQHGYETIFATDETRFSNMQKRFGFDHIISPPIGFNDFFIGTLNDFPISNLLVNTALGRYLFPYSFGNRPAYTTYNPSSFLKLLSPALAKSREKPLFLAVHLCLAHYPYLWATSSHTHAVQDYQASVKQVDKQVQELLTMLKDNKLLEHSIVVLLSDHGEAIWLSGDRVTEADLFIPGADNKGKTIPHFYPPSKKNEKVNQSVGHGTDVLGLTQYHNVLAFRLFGLEGQKASIVPGRVSLLDIKPTVLSLLKIDATKQSGQSLADYIFGKKSYVFSEQHFFMESDFAPEAIRTVHPETRKVLFQGIDFFEINPVTTRITVKKSMADLIISSKQYADLFGPWILALYPQHNKPMVPILVNLDTGYWTNDLQTSFAKQAPVDHMISALKDFYGHEIKKIEHYSS